VSDSDFDHLRRRLVEIADELLEQAAELKRQYAALDRVAAGEPEPVESEEAGGRPEPELGLRDPLRLIAVEMALSGHTRDEVATYVRDAYGVEANPAMLDAVFSRVGG
jgi:hypothetical protein